MFARSFSPRHHDDVSTPKAVYEALDAEFGPFDCDPCPLGGRQKGPDGLSDEFLWGQRTFVNPPYSNVRPWIRKAIAMRALGKRTVLLVPCGIARKYWRELVLPEASEIRILTQNLTFEGYARPLPMLMAILVFDPARPPPSTPRTKGNGPMSHVCI
jgi:hypothetical protein